MSDMGEASPEMVGLGMAALQAMDPAALQARMGAVVAAVMESLVTLCPCDTCETLRGVFQGIVAGG